MRWWLALLLAGACATVQADALVDFCYNWSCKEEVGVWFSDPLLIGIKRDLALSRDAADERQRVARSVGKLFAEAATQTLIANDLAGNGRDSERDGRMDCIDHSTSTTRLLQLLETRGWLRWHRVLEPARRARFILVQHFAAQLEELPAVLAEAEASFAEEFADAVPRERFVVDTWFVDPGQPAVVMPLENWMRGDGPDVD